VSGGGHGGPVVSLARIDILLIVLEILVIILYLQATHRVPESRASAKLVLTGSVAPLFWFGVAVIGLLTPLVFELSSVFAMNGSGSGVATLVASVCGLLGGLFLRQVVLSGGILAPLRAGRFEFALP
jgi:formate-dependent nitrite reductase membrane component NrfD